MSKPFTLTDHLAAQKIRGLQFAEHAAWKALCAEPMTSQRAECLAHCAVTARDMANKAHVERATFQMEDSDDA